MRMIVVKDLAHAQTLLEKFVRPMTPGAYTLELMRSLMAYLGNPQDALKIIHVAGTSGKTSTSYYTAALLLENGFKVGLGVSPHIDSVSERAQINLQPLPEALYCKELSIFLDLIEQSELQPSYFELLVAFSFWLFERQKVDYEVIEVGLGGLLDGTNVINREDKICIITDIGYDHTEILGKTLTKIAAQKAGIIHNGNQVFMHQQTSEITDVIKNTSLLKSASLHVITGNAAFTQPNFTNLPEFQQRNFTLAYEAIKNILPQPAHIENALSVYIPARMEEVQLSTKTIVLDGSHNEQKIGKLIDAMKKKYPNQSVVLLVSFGQNKSASLEKNLSILREISSHIIITQFHLGQDEIRRAIEPLVIAEQAKKLGFTAEIEDNPQTAFRHAQIQSEDIVLVTGSFYLLNHVRPLIRAEAGES